MNIEEMPADQIMTMTEDWHRAFNAAGCNPMCHCCGKLIAPAKDFKLATAVTYQKKHGSNTGIDIFSTTESREVMLCDLCTVNKMNKRTAAAVEKYRVSREENNGGCFRVNGKIIH